MKKYVFMVLMFLLAIPNSGSADDVVMAELNNFQGTWNMVRAENVGKDIRERIGYNQVVVEGNTTLVKFKGEIRKSRFKIDPTKAPKQITYITNNGIEVRGIYELNGDTWRQLLSKFGEEHPKSFNEVGQFYEYKRAKQK